MTWNRHNSVLLPLKKQILRLEEWPELSPIEIKKVWLRLYQIYVRPQLEYAIQAWRPWLSKDIELMERVQRRAVRMTSGLKGTSYEEKLAEVGLQSLEDRRVRGDAIQTWKILTKYDNVSEDHWFKRRTNVTEQVTRRSTNSLNLEEKDFRHEYRKYSFSVRAPKVWNKLPDHVREAKNLQTFKRKYDKFLSVFYYSRRFKSPWIRFKWSRMWPP